MAGILNKIMGVRGRSQVLAAHNRRLARLDPDRRLSDCCYVVFDTELTGLNHKRDEIIAIGAVRIRNLQIALGETFHYYVRPRSMDHTRATLIHKITPQQLESAPPLEEVLPQFLGFIGGDLLVGHYVPIDTSFLNRATRQLYHGTVANPSLDTMRMAQVYKREVLGDYHGAQRTDDGSYNLQRLSAQLNLPFFEAHDALEDSLQTAYLFIFLVKKLGMVGIVTLRDLFSAGKEIAMADRKHCGL